MKTASAVKLPIAQEKSELKEYFAQNPDVVVFKEKVEEALQWMKQAGITPEVLRKMRENYKGSALLDMSEIKLKKQTEDYVFELFAN